MQVVDLEADQCAAAEEEIVVAVGVLREGEVDLATGDEGCEEVVLVLEEGEGELVIPISQGLALEAVVHSTRIWRYGDMIFIKGQISKDNGIYSVEIGFMLCCHP